jgi:hypothetical protein
VVIKKTIGTLSQLRPKSGSGSNMGVMLAGFFSKILAIAAVAI